MITERTGFLVTVGNLSSPHIGVWIDEAKHLGWEHLHVESHTKNYATILIQMLRARREARRRSAAGDRVAIQAHGAGRAGLLAAVLMGPRITVIVHGSEVIAADQARHIARRLVAWVLGRAEQIIVTAEATKDFVVRLAPGTQSRTRVIHPGVRWSSFSGSHSNRDGELVSVLSIRRMLPLYQILNFVRAQQRQSAHQRAVLLRGAVGDEEPYAAEVAEYVGTHVTNCEIIESFLSEQGLVDQYRQADVAVSLAATDQMSVSILEALAAGCVLVLSDLDAYECIKTLPHVVLVPSSPTVDEIEAALVGARDVLMKDGRGSQDRERRAKRAERAFEVAYEDVAALLS